VRRTFSASADSNTQRDFANLVHVAMFGGGLKPFISLTRLGKAVSIEIRDFHPPSANPHDHREGRDHAQDYQGKGEYEGHLEHSARKYFFRQRDNHRSEMVAGSITRTLYLRAHRRAS
jgi:hypothetical protein